MTIADLTELLYVNYAYLFPCYDAIPVTAIYRAKKRENGVRSFRAILLIEFLAEVAYKCCTERPYPIFRDNTQCAQLRLSTGFLGFSF